MGGLTRPELSPDLAAILAAGPIAVMDAECAICTRGARMIHRLDRGREIRIAPVQFPLGAALARAAGVDPADPETWLLFDGTRLWRDAEAIIHVGERSGGWGRSFTALRLLPRGLRDWLYRRLARNRYRLFGRGDMCALPDPAFRARLLTGEIASHLTQSTARAETIR